MCRMGVSPEEAPSLIESFARGSELELEGVVVNQYQHRASQPRRIVDELIAEGRPVFESFLGSSVKMRESHEASEPLIYGSLNHKLTQQFIALFEEMEGVSVDQSQLAIAVAEEEEVI